MATLKDVAHLSGVTVTTISRMLNNRVNVSEKTRAKILVAMEELDYHPNELAQSLIKQKSSFIGLIVPSAKNFFFGAVIDCVERHVCASERDFIAMRYEPLIHQLFQEHPEVNGVFSSNDIIAAQVLQYCSQQGIDVPGRMTVVGYDDTDLACLTTPPLTTIHQPVEDICRWAVERIVAGESAGAPEARVFPVQLIQRQST